MKKIVLFFGLVLCYVFSIAQATKELADNDCNPVCPASVISQPVNNNFTLNLEPDYSANTLVAVYSIPRKEDVKLSIFTEHGKLVKGNIIKKAKQGVHNIVYDLKEIASGKYLIWLTAHNDNLILKFTVPD